jgi:hypothetical protein
MLPAACRWIDSAEGSYLHWHSRCIATVKPAGRRWETVITWCERRHAAFAGSRAQGKRWVDRWVSAQRGLPTSSGIERRAERARADRAQFAYWLR